MRTPPIAFSALHISGAVYYKLMKIMFNCLILVYIYPFFFAVSGIDPTLPLDVQSPNRIVYFLQLAIPILCIVIGILYRGLDIFFSAPPAVFLYAFICFLSAFWSVNPYDTFKYSLLLFLYIMSIVAVCNVIDIEYFCRIIMKLFVFIIISSVVMSVAFPYYGTHQPGDTFEGVHAGLWRGVFTHKNILGAAAANSLFIFLFFRRLMGVSFGFRMVCIFAAIMCLILAQSAGSWVVMCVLLAFYCLIRYTPVSASIIMLMSFFIITLASISFFFFSDELTALFGRDATLTGRTEIWPIVLDAIWQEPLIGFGYYSAMADFLGPILVSATGASHAHNGYLDVLLGTGILGLSTLLFCIFSVLRVGLDRVKMLARSEADCFLMLLFFLISGLVFSLFETGIPGPVESVTGALTFASLTAIPLYLRRTPAIY